MLSMKHRTASHLKRSPNFSSKISAEDLNRVGVLLFLQVNVTADHRIIYGADLAAFLQTFSKIVENPESLTL